MKIANKKVKKKLVKFTLNAWFFIILGAKKTHFLLNDKIWLKFLIFWAVKTVSILYAGNKAHSL